MKKVLLTFLFIIAGNSYAEMGRLYYNNFLGHLHENPSKDSTSLTIVQCSHSVKLLKSSTSIDGWRYVQVGEDKGYIQSQFLVKKRPQCLQEKYPKFYNQFDLNLSEMYYWGRLYDLYLQGKSKIK